MRAGQTEIEESHGQPCDHRYFQVLRLTSILIHSACLLVPLGEFNIADPDNGFRSRDAYTVFACLLSHELHMQ